MKSKKITKNNNILIIGLGKMGIAHLESFANRKDCFFYLVEKNINRRKIIKKKLKNLSINFNLLPIIPNKKKIDFAIVATNPKERFAVATKLIKTNFVKFLFLEKYLFNNFSEYKIFGKLIKRKKIKTYVNIWSEIFIKVANLSKLNSNNFTIDVFLTNHTILTNLIHFYYLFYLMVPNKKIDIDFSKFKIKKRGSYHDGIGEIYFKNGKNKMKIFSNKKEIFVLEAKNKFSNKKIKYKNKFLTITNNGKFFKKKFPLASVTTNKFYNQLIGISNDPAIMFPKFNEISEISTILLKQIQDHFAYKVQIR